MITALLLATAIVIVVLIVVPLYFPSARIDTVSQALVAIGTLALAIVTVGSVLETKQIISSEDLRFQQSKMPMVRIVEANVWRDDIRSWVSEDQLTSDRQPAPCYRVEYINQGEGPALNVRLEFRSIVKTQYFPIVVQAVGESGIRESLKLESMVSHTGDQLASYVPPKISDFVHLGIEHLEPIARAGAHMFFTNEIEQAVLIYEDMFGLEYKTFYDNPNLWRPTLHRWERPEKLMPQK